MPDFSNREYFDCKYADRGYIEALSATISPLWPFAVVVITGNYKETVAWCSNIRQAREVAALQ
jgi:hypothetical protein